MKKEYIEPSVKAVEIKSATILAGSEIKGSNEITDGNKILSDDFDFEEEEDY